MICFKLLFITLLYVTLIFISTTISFSEENSENEMDLTNPFRLTDYIIPHHYNIDIMLLPYDKSEITYFVGTCNIYIYTYRPTHIISLHAQKPQIEISRANLINNAFIIDSGIEEKRYTPQYNTYNNESHILKFHFIEELPIGNYSLIMNFIGNLNDNNKSIFKNSYVTSAGQKIWLYATYFQTIGARQIFPCWDEPKFKATFNISIKYRKEYTVLSNMDYAIIQSLYYNPIQWMHFKITPNISTYHVAFCLWTDKWSKFINYFHYDLYSNETGSSDIIIWNRNSSEVSFATEVIKKIAIYSENNLRNLKISTIQHVLIPGLRYNAIEKWGLILYRETAIIYDQTIDSLAHKIEVACLIARQTAHQWFGNTVSPSWWSHHWLNQGIATLLGIDVVHKYFADFRPLDLFVVQMQQESLRLDDYSIVKPLISEINKPSEISSLLSFSYYIKAPAILRMLQRVLTNEIFVKGIKKFYNTHSATLDDFYSEMQIIYNTERTDYMKSFIIKDMMEAWTKQKHYPILKVTNDFPFLKIKIENYNNSYMIYDWWIPIMVTDQTKSDYLTFEELYAHGVDWIKLSQSNNLTHFFPYTVEKNDWYIINLQQIGYYRVNYELNNWQNIAKYLNSTKYTNIHVLNRAEIIDDAYYFAKTGKLNFSIFLELTEYLSRETDYVAWYPMFKALEDVSSIFPFEESNIIKTKILNRLNGLLRNIGYDKKPNEKVDDLIDCLRQEATKWACILGASNCTKTAENKLHQYLTNTKTNKVLPWLRYWTFCNGLMKSNSKIWYEVWNLHIKNSSTMTSKFLACSDHFYITVKYIHGIVLNDLLKKGFIKERRDNFFNAFHYIIVRHANNKKILDDLLRNLMWISKEYIVAILIDIINHVYSEEQLNQISKFMNISNENIGDEHVSLRQLLTDKFDEIFKINGEVISFYKPEETFDIIINSFIHHKIKLRKSEISRHSSRFQKIA